MGGTNSVISRSYIYDKLNDEQKQQYLTYEQECKDKGMSENQINDFLAAKYTEVFGVNPETLNDDTVSLAESSSHETDVPVFDVVTNPLGNIELTIRPGTCSASEKDELLRDIADAYAELDDDDDDDSVDGFEDDIVSQLFSEKPDVVIEPNRFCCLTCKLDFETEVLLNTHVNHSEIHKTAIEKRNQTVKEGKRHGRRLSLIAMDAIMRLNEILKHTSSHSSTSDQVPKLKSAVHRAITKKITSHYEKVAENMFFSPKDVKLMHSETKLFVVGGASATYDIRMYLHYDLHCIEIICHLLKNAPDPRTALKVAPEIEPDSFEDADFSSLGLSMGFGAGNSYKGGGSGQYSPGSSRKLKNFRHLSFGYQMSLADAGLLPTNAMQHNIEVVELPRIYLDYNSVLDVVMGLNSQFNSLDSVSELPEPQLKNASPGSLSPRSEAKIHHVGNRAIGGVSNMTIDDCIIAFVNSHLKYKCTTKRIKEEHDYDIIFTGVNTNVQINPPRNLIAQAAAPEKTILVQWEASWINL